MLFSAMTRTKKILANIMIVLSFYELPLRKSLQA